MGKSIIKLRHTFVIISLLTAFAAYALESNDENFVQPIEVAANSIHNLGLMEIGVPSSWTKKGLDKNTLMFIEPPDGMKYQKNLLVKKFNGKRFIDEITASTFKEMVNTKFPSSIRSIREYVTDEPEFVDLEDGNLAILMYSNFELLGKKMMHMHLVLTGDKNHYLLTYSDLYENLTREDSQSFQNAWQILSNVSVPHTPGGGRYQNTIYTGVGIGSVLMAFLIFAFVRRKKAGLAIDRFDGEDTDDDFDGGLDADHEWNLHGSRDDEGDDDFEESA